MKKKIKAAFLDRDGVINYDFGYIKYWNDFIFIPNTINALQKLQDLGFTLFIVTNQSGIARGLYSIEEYKCLQEHIETHLKKKYSIEIASTYFCPHHPDGTVTKYKKECDCRKPKIGLIKKAMTEYEINLDDSILFGDKLSDIEMGKSAGVNKCYLINSKYIDTQEKIHTYKNLNDAVKAHLKNEKL